MARDAEPEEEAVTQLVVSQILLDVDLASKVPPAVLTRLAHQEKNRINQRGHCPVGPHQTGRLQDIDGQWYTLTCEVEGDCLLVTAGKKTMYQS